MEIDMKKLETAIIYVQRIAEGNNPINNMPEEDDSVLNNPNVIRCMYYIEEVLKAVRDNGGIGNLKKEKKSKKSEFPFEVLSKFAYREDVGIAKLIDQIYEPVKAENYKKFSGKKIHDWMINQGYLEEVYVQELCKNYKMPTEKGKSIGLRAERMNYGATGNSYIKIIYNKQAQEFIVSNIEKIVKG